MVNKETLNQEFLKSIESEYIFDNAPINRFKKNKETDDASERLIYLKDKIKSIQDCELKKFAKNIVFSDGNPKSQIMIVGEGPGEKEDLLGKPFVGEAGMLLNKMLNAIKIKRENIYITNVVNYRPPNNRKPEFSEIKRYSVFLREHISIINPKILILMGSTAMEALLGQKLKISKERGKWKEIIINQKTFQTILTFHPAYLLRQPDQKKFSWEDLKSLRKKIDELNIKI
jgi:uracil-DNA glycosylase family 4